MSGLALLAGLYAGAARADQLQSEAPLRIRNVFPVANLYGLPRVQGAAVVAQGTELTISLDQGSNFTSDGSGFTAAFFDGETSVVSLAVRRPLRADWEWGAELPYIVHSGGFLDGFLDDFHDLFGLTDGGRSRAAKNRIDYLVRESGVTYADFQKSRRGPGDPRFWLGRSVLSSPERSLSVRGMVKLPVGEVSDLSGSEALDVSVWTEYAQRALLGYRRLSLSAMAGLVLLGRGDLAPNAQEHVAATGHVGLQYRLTPRLLLNAQVDGHSQLLNSSVDQIGGAAVQGALGGRFNVRQALWLDFAIVEDLRAQSSSDVVFQMALGARL